MARAEYLKLFPFPQQARRRQYSPLPTHLLSLNICTVCAMRQRWWAKQHLDVRRVATMSTAVTAQRTTGSAANMSGSSVTFSFITQFAFSKRDGCKQSGVIGDAGSRKSIAQRNASTSTLSDALWQSPLFLRKTPSHRFSWSQSRVLSSRRASDHTSTTAPIPTAPPNAANINNAATSSVSSTGSSTSQLQKLYDALTQLRASGAASIHVDTNRLNLAIKGVEDSLRGTDGTTTAASGPVVRMAGMAIFYSLPCTTPLICLALPILTLYIF